MVHLLLGQTVSLWLKANLMYLSGDSKPYQVSMSIQDDASDCNHSEGDKWIWIYNGATVASANDLGFREIQLVWLEWWL